jgi:hypothetical protein
VAHAARRPGRQDRHAGLLLTRLQAVLLLALAACANTGAPPGGPPDEKPPVILGVYPESGAVVTDLHGDAVIQYDGVIDEQPGSGGGAAGGGGGGGGGGGTAGLASRVLLSPTRGPVKVSWHRSSIHVKPQEGWKPGRVYHLEILPGIADLQRNATKDRRLIVFSTGPAIPAATISGVAVQWVEQRPLLGGLIRAVPLPDTIAYLTMTDSSGAFTLEQLPRGRYTVYAVVDQNANRVRDRREAYDSTSVTLDSSAALVLWAFSHDTIGPRLRQADAVDSSAVRLTFTQPLDPALRIDSLRVRVVVLPDSAPVRVQGLFTSADFDSLTARERAAADSARAANDTTAPRAPRAPRDTTKRDTTEAPAPAPTARPGRPGARREEQDTSAVHLILEQRPVPQDKLVLRVDTTLAPGGRYFIEVLGARNLNGARGEGHTVLVVPKPKPVPAARADSTRAPPPADSTRAKPDSSDR